MMTKGARTGVFVASALTAFAANSLLTRAAVGGRFIDAITFTEIRLATGAATLLALAWTTGRLRSPAALGLLRGDTWSGAAALGAYAFAFAFAYARVDASVGALVLFGGVQLTMLGWGIFAGERPRLLEWLGLLTALGGLAVLTRPGRTSPDVVGAMLMALAGAAWGVYSLRGRGAGDALRRTAASFAGATLAGLIVLALTHGHAVTPRGVLLASVSGAIASGLGYTLWYASLPGLSAFRAAVLQLGVPVITAAAAIPLLGERPTLRLVTAGLLILGGIALALAGRRRHT